MDKSVVINDDFKMNFNVQTSPGGQYYIVNAISSCIATNKRDCISSSYLSFSPKTSAVLTCWKYEGMTVSMGKDGEVKFDSDNPLEKEHILKVLAKKQSNLSSER